MAEQPTCDSCKRGKFDPPRAKCREVDFHWLRAGTKWDFDGDAYKPVVTGAADNEMFDGLLVREDDGNDKVKWEELLNLGDPAMPKAEKSEKPSRLFSLAEKAFIEGRSNKEV